MAGYHKTFSDELSDAVSGVMRDAVAQSTNSKSGIVFGEDHQNNEFHELLASNILDDASEIAGDREKLLFVEWDNSPENLQLVHAYNQTGDSTIRERLVTENINFPDDNSERIAEASFSTALERAHESGFKLAIFDEEGVSLDAYYEAAAAKAGKNTSELTQEEIEQAKVDRISDSNPVMAKNIQEQIPDNSFSIVIVGDRHANENNDLPEALGFEYVRFVRSSQAPEIKQDVGGAKLDIALVDLDLQKELEPDIQRMGIDFVPVLLSEKVVPWGGDENKEFMSDMNNKIEHAGNLISAQRLDDAKVVLGEVKSEMENRWDQDQISKDPYLKSVINTLDTADKMVSEEIKSQMENSMDNQNEDQFNLNNSSPDVMHSPDLPPVVPSHSL